MAQTKKRRKPKGKGQILHKQLLEKRNKDYLSLLKRIAVASGAEEAFSKLSAKELFILERVRLDSFRIKKAENSKISKLYFEKIKDFALYYMKNTLLTVAEGKPQISLYDFYSGGFTLLLYLIALEERKVSWATELREAFKPLLELENKPQEMMYNYSVIIGWLFSEIDNGYCFLKYEQIKDSKNHIYEQYLIDFAEPEIKHFKIDGANRPAYKLAYISEDAALAWAKIKASDIYIHASSDERFLDVYIQSHALHRLGERLDGMNCVDFNSYLSATFKNPKIIKNFKGKKLIEFSGFDKKLGYFIAEIINGAVLLKTFLFLTHDGTPEGDKLKELAGLNMTGKKYFKIDTLSTFYKSDIENDERLKGLFVQAGCESLFDIVTAESEKHKGEIKTASALLKYLRIEEQQELLLMEEGA